MSKCNCQNCNECSCSCSSKKTFNFLGGLTLGASLALLFTPKNGKENREALKTKMDEIYDYLKNIDKEEVKKDIEKKLDELKKDIEALDKETVVRVAKEKAEIIQEKMTEVYEYAKEKSAPVVDKAVKTVKEKATPKKAKATKKAVEKKPTAKKTTTKKTTKKSTK